MLATLLPDSRPPAVAWAAPPALPAQQAPLPLLPVVSVEQERTPPDPQAAALVVALVEAVSGRRSPHQLSRWATEEVLAGVVARRRAGVGPFALRSLRMQRDGATAELAARLQTGERHVALAVALERQGGRWLCTAADFGPCGGVRP